MKGIVAAGAGDPARRRPAIPYTRLVRDDELRTVFSAKEASANAEAEVLKSLLESAGIHSIIKWIPPTFQNPGGIRLLVLESEADDAAEIIRDAQEGSLDEPVEER